MATPQTGNLRSQPEWGACSASTHSNQTTSPLPGTEDASHLPACDTPPYRSIAKRARGRWVATPRATRVRPAGGALGGSKCALARSTHGSGGVRWVVDWVVPLGPPRSARPAPYGRHRLFRDRPPVWIQPAALWHPTEVGNYIYTLRPIQFRLS